MDIENAKPAKNMTEGVDQEKLEGKEPDETRKRRLKYQTPRQPETYLQ
jgi:hypothetical protein